VKINSSGLGMTIDVVLVSGVLYVNDRLVICGINGPIVTTVRALLTPQPLKELRVKGEYVHHKEIQAAMGVKISAPGLEDAVAGTSILLARDLDDVAVERLQDEVMKDMTSILSNVDRTGVGVYVMASTLGSLEALLQFLKTSKIPVFAVNIGRNNCITIFSTLTFFFLGSVHKRDVKKAAVMREKGHPEYSCILAFDVKVDVEANKDAAVFGVKIFTADIIYHLFDSFEKYVAEVTEQKK
jgi:translation initiation factor IF-2